MIRDPNDKWRGQLEPHEIAMLTQQGTDMHQESQAMALREKKHTVVDGGTLHVLGVKGEYFVACVTGRKWIHLKNTFKRIPDVDDWEVRTRSRHSYELMLRPGDALHRVQILVTTSGYAAVDFWARGWTYGTDVSTDEFWGDPNGKGYAWWVSPSSLHPMDELPGLNPRTWTFDSNTGQGLLLSL